MVYNKFKRGFFRNLLSYVMMLFFLTITVLLVVFDHNPVRIMITIVACLGLIMFLVYDLFFSEVFIFDNEGFHTNKYPLDHLPYAPKLFKKTFIRFNEITKVEKRVWNNKRFVLIIFIRNKEPLQYIFTHADTRDFVYHQLTERMKR